MVPRFSPRRCDTSRQKFSAWNRLPVARRLRHGLRAYQAHRTAFAPAPGVLRAPPPGGSLTTMETPSPPDHIENNYIIWYCLLEHPSWRPLWLHLLAAQPVNPRKPRTFLERNARLPLLHVMDVSYDGAETVAQQPLFRPVSPSPKIAKGIRGPRSEW